MTKAKTGFVLYFDSYPMLAVLSPEQRGWLLSALMIFADRVWQDGTVTLEEILEQFPQLSGEARMAGAFIGAAIQRDTNAWLAKAKYRQQKRQPQTAPAARDERERQDMDQMRRLMEQFKSEES